MFSSEFLDYQDSDAREKKMFFVENSSTSVVFSIEDLIEEIKLVVAED